MRVKNINSVLPISYLEGLNEEMVMSVVNTAEQAGVCIACRQYQATIVDSENKFTFYEIYVRLIDYEIFIRFTQTRP